MERRHALTRAQHELPIASSNARLSLAVAATFTSEPLEEPLKFWFETLEIDATVTSAPYGQLLQELLSPRSTLARNADGVNVLLVRPEDWLRERFSANDIDRNL